MLQMRALALFLCVFPGVVFAVPVQISAKQVLVMDLRAEGVDAKLARNLSEIFALHMRKGMPNAKVIGQDDIENMLALEKQRDLVGCNDISCLAEIGGALGADVMAFGSVGKVGTMHMVTLKVADAAKAETLRHVSEEVSGAPENLIEAVRQLSARLLDDEAPTGLGFIDIGGVGSVEVDGKPAGAAPLLFTTKAGQHTVEWTGDDEALLQVEVRAYATTAAVPPVEEGAPKWSRGLFLQTDIGVMYPIGGPSEDIQAAGMEPALPGLTVGYQFDNGVRVMGDVHLRYVRFDDANIADTPGGDTDHDIEGWEGGLGVGYAMGRKILLVPGVRLGVLRAKLIPSGGNEQFRDALVSDLGWGDTTDTVITAAPFFETSFSPFSPITLGARLQLSLLFTSGGLWPSFDAAATVGVIF